MNLSLREVAALTRRIAEMSGNPHYRISASSLYDYEQSADTPRDFRKIASLCAIYGLNLRIFLQAMGIKSQEEASEPIPDSILRRQSFAPSGRESSSVQPAGFLEHLQERLGDIPVFLRNSLDTLSGSSKIAFDDFYWIGGEHTPLHPYLVNGLLAIVNRRRKTAFHFASKPLWEQPIYLILKRDREYLAACCGAENGTLVIHPYGPEFFPPLVFRNHQDAEVIGQFIAVLRNIR